MTVHIGRVTSEVRSTAPVEVAAVDQEEITEWEKRIRLAAVMERFERDRLRTATGHTYE